MKKIKYLLIGLVGTIVFCLFGGWSVNAYNDYRRIGSYVRADQIVSDSNGYIQKVFPYDTHTIAVNYNCNLDDYYYYLTNDYFVLDLKGNTLTNKNTSDGEYKTLFDVGSNAKLTIIDSVGGGKLEGGILLSDSSRELIINDGIIGNSDLEGEQLL